jgi:alpha-galactosidase
MPKISFLGAGSTVFAKRLLVDILSYPELENSTVSLHDIDAERLRTSEIVAHKIAQAVGAHPVIETTMDRRASLAGSGYVVGMFQIAGYKPGTVTDFEIPKKYGLRQTIGDTLGIGGIMRGLRTIPVLLDMCHDMEEVCPDATFFNYVNPLAMNCWAISRAGSIKTIGMCHSTQVTAAQLARDIGVPFDEISYLCAGINHMAFYLRFQRRTADGLEDLYPLIRRVVEEGRVPDWNRVRYEFFSKLGYFVTESSEHFSEYVPWFIKRDRPDLIERFRIPLDEYIRRCEGEIGMWETLRDRLEDPDASLQEPTPEMVAAVRRMLDTTVMPPELVEEIFELKRSGEYAPRMIHSMETGSPSVTYGDVPNYGLIDNLPEGSCVEVPCVADSNGVRPVRIGSLPPHLAALIQTNVNVQALTVEAALTRKREYIYGAAMLDPHTAAELDMDQIWHLVDDLIEAHGDWLPAYH